MDRHVRLVEERVDAVNVFDFDCFVVTIKTHGRWYGRVSEQFIKRYPDVQIPDIGYGTSSEPVALADGKHVIFTCLWTDQETGKGGLGYREETVVGCTGSAVRIAGMNGFEELAIPLIGGGEKIAMKPAMGRGLQEAFDLLRRNDRDPDDLEVIIASISTRQGFQTID